MYIFNNIRIYKKKILNNFIKKNQKDKNSKFMKLINYMN